MAEDLNQDMEMEDILSSIKNILEEDQALSSASEEKSDEDILPINEPSAIAEETPEDDILELSPDMRVEDKVAENTEINLDAELDGVDTASLLSIPTDENSSKVTLGTEDFDSDPFYEGTEDLAEKYEENITNNDIVDVTLETVSDQSSSSEVLSDVVLEPKTEIISEPVLEDKQEYVPDPKTELEDKQEYVPEPELVDEVSADNAVDVSASIISNFAKLFSREGETKKEETPIVQNQEPIHIIGDGNKTIEDVVASVIKQIIGSEVAEHWKEGLDYNNLSHQEIAKQTKEWLDLNLPSVVEKIVKQEIERVMAKVGNNQ